MLTRTAQEGCFANVDAQLNFFVMGPVAIGLWRPIHLSIHLRFDIVFFSSARWCSFISSIYFSFPPPGGAAVHVLAADQLYSASAAVGWL